MIKIMSGMIGLYCARFSSNLDDLGLVRKPKFESIYSKYTPRIAELLYAGVFCFKRTPRIAGPAIRGGVLTRNHPAYSSSAIRGVVSNILG